MSAAAAWQDVARILVKRWPGGAGNRGWEREQIAGFIEELQVDRLTPEAAIRGLRACESGFVPSVGEVRRLAREAKGPPTGAEIAAAEQLFRERQEARQREISEQQRQISP